LGNPIDDTTLTPKLEMNHDAHIVAGYGKYEESKALDPSSEA
jgi:hypothetical protein